MEGSAEARRDPKWVNTYCSKSGIMGTPLMPVKIAVGDRIKDQFVVKKKIGEGACGTVYLVLGTGNKKTTGAMKIEPVMKSKDDEILKMDIYVLRKLQNSAHVCRFLGAGKKETYTFLIMSLLGHELSEIRRKLPNRKMNTSSILRVSIQTFKALEDMHNAGFIHRDVKPSNLAMGTPPKRNIVFLFDFGLARQIMLPDESGKLVLREPRNKVMFRGTVRYCSINVHQYKEQGRHDDLFGALYAMIECHTSNLPWKGMPRKEAYKIKEQTSDVALCKGCPPSFLEIAKILRKLTYQDTPPYQQIHNLIATDIKKAGIKLTDPFEWDMGNREPTVEEAPRRKKDAPEIDKDPEMDRKTTKEVEDSVITESKEEPEEGNDFAAENTLDNLSRERD